MEYTVESIYGSYVQQNNKTNGRNWYRNDARAIWWDGNNDWFIGNIHNNDRLGGNAGYASLKKDGACLPKISNTNWRLWDGISWDDAGKKINVHCGFQTSGRCAFRHDVTILNKKCIRLKLSFIKDYTKSKTYFLQIVVQKLKLF